MRPIIAVTMGDPAGIGPEICVKAYKNGHFHEKCKVFILGSRTALSDALRYTGTGLTLRELSDPSQAEGRPDVLDFIDPRPLAGGEYTPGRVNPACGDAAFAYVHTAIEYCKSGLADAVATGPLNKEALNKAGHHFDGHTEIFAHYTNTKSYTMLLASGSLRVVHVSTHVPLSRACELVTSSRVYETIRLADQALRLLGMESGRIAVSGLNPHASDNGLFGAAEAQEIAPAIEKARRDGLDVTGPIPPDSVFVRALGGEFDIVVAMYHDQGHIPLKLSGFKLDPETGRYAQMSGINMTIGIPILRTSVDHGTAFDRARCNTANEGSMLEAIETACAAALAKEKSK
jgi:4-hydroxythreonine-4-phosphate dehydrogenase